jgi:hypothetical protein
MRAKFLILMSSLLAFGCDSPTPKPVAIEIANLCDKANNLKDVETTGFFSWGTNINCTTGTKEIPAICQLHLSAARGRGSVQATVKVGTGPNTMNWPGLKYRPEQITVRDADGQQVREFVPVTVTGMMQIYNACHFMVRTIRRAAPPQ